MADRARLVHRRDDDDVAERRERVGQRRDALRPIPVVVGDEDEHELLIIRGSASVPARFAHERASTRTLAAGISSNAAVETIASPAPTPNATGAPSSVHSTPNTRLAASAPTPSTAV